MYIFVKKIMEQKIKIGNLELVLSDNKIKSGDFFVEFNDGKVKQNLYQYLEEKFENYHFNGIDVVVVNEINNINYKRVENI